MAHTKDARFQERRQLRKLRQRERDIARASSLDDLTSTYPALTYLTRRPVTHSAT